MSETYPMVRVRWHDSCDRDNGGWTRIERMTPLAEELLDCLTVGFLLGENEVLLRVALSITDDDHPDLTLGTILIPRCSVVKLEYLTVKRAK